MGTKITITIEVDDSGGVSVDAGEKKDLSVSSSYVPSEPFLPEDHNYKPEAHGDKLPFVISPQQTDIHRERVDSPDTIDRAAADIIEEQNNRFAAQFAESLGSDPVVGDALRASLATDAVMDAINVAADEVKDGK